MDYYYGADAARYLFIRLCLRKTDQWFRLGDLKYHSHLGTKILPAMRELCSLQSTTIKQTEKVDQQVKREEQENLIDLTVDEEVKPVIPEIKSQKGSPCSEPLPPPDYRVFAEDDSCADLRELLECLRVDELRDIAKKMHLQRKEHTVNGSHTVRPKRILTTSLISGMLSLMPSCRELWVKQP